MPTLHSKASGDTFGAVSESTPPPGHYDLQTPSTNPIRTKGPLWRLFSELLGPPERRRLLTALGALVVSSATNLAFPTVLGRAVDLACSSTRPPTFKILVAGIFTTFGVGAFASWLRVYKFGITGHMIETKLRKRMFERLLKRDISAMDSSSSGDVANRIVVDATVAAQSMTETIAKCLRALNSSIGGTIMLLLISRKLTFLSLSFVPLLGMGAMMYSKYIKRLRQRQSEQLDVAMSHLIERMAHMDTVKLFAQEYKESSMFSLQLDSTTPITRSVAAADGLFMGCLSFSVNASLLCVLYFGGCLVQTGEMTVGHLTSFALYSSMVGLGFSSLSQVYGDVVKARVSIRRIYEILDETLTTSRAEGAVDGLKAEDAGTSKGQALHPHGKNPVEHSAASSEQSQKLMSMLEAGELKGAIKLEDVGYAYPTRPSVHVLKNLSVEIKQGDVVAIVGPSGCGKSTMCRLITQLLRPKTGQIFLDGIDLAKVDGTLLRQHVFGVVSQEPVLFSGTIRDNILYGIDQKELDCSNPDSVMLKAAKLANAHEFVTSFPDGYDTRLGELTQQLSVGQKQRIAIARAIAKDPRVLIFDEATSALDAESERQVQNAMDQAMQGRTVIVIAHRVNTIQMARNVVLLGDGHVVEMGNYKDLMGRDSKLKQLISGDSGVTLEL